MERSWCRRRARSSVSCTSARATRGGSCSRRARPRSPRAGRRRARSGRSRSMAHQAKDYRRLVGECRGFLSEKQLTAHFELYEGYVKKLNEIEEGLRAADPES